MSEPAQSYHRRSVWHRIIKQSHISSRGHVGKGEAIWYEANVVIRDRRPVQLLSVNSPKVMQPATRKVESNRIVIDRDIGARPKANDNPVTRPIDAAVLDRKSVPADFDVLLQLTRSTDSCAKLSPDDGIVGDAQSVAGTGIAVSGSLAVDKNVAVDLAIAQITKIHASGRKSD